MPARRRERRSLELLYVLGRGSQQKGGRVNGPLSDVVPRPAAGAIDRRALGGGVNVLGNLEALAAALAGVGLIEGRHQTGVQQQAERRVEARH